MFIQKLLIPFGMLNSTVMDARNALYDRGIFRVHDLGVRTISVGNLTTGGTGKTPLVAMIAEILAEQGETVCILTRGYGRKNARERVVVSDGKTVLANAETGGDEPVELARKLIGKAIVVADADRVSAGVWAKEKFGVTAFILDDGFQHRRVKRDLDIVCIDATNPCGNGRILPTGTLRESFTGLARADAIVLTRTNLISNDEASAITKRLRNKNNEAAIFGLQTSFGEITKLDDFLAGQTTSDDNEDRQIAASTFVFCGLGNPNNFRKTLSNEGFNVVGHHYYPDHKYYRQVDIEWVEALALNSGAKSLLTTAKDAVKLSGLNFKLPIFVAESKPLINDQAGFKRLIISS